MAQRAGRIVCPRCGANNFDTVTACWKCSAPLGGGAAASPVPVPSAAPATSTPAASPVPSYSPVEQFGYRAAAAATTAGTALMGNPTAANRAALWLGLLLPYFGLPIGLAFMMCDDRRRQEVGRICLLWSTLSMIVHLLLGFAAMLGMREYFQMALGTLKAQAGRAGGMRGLDEP